MTDWKAHVGNSTKGGYRKPKMVSVAVHLASGKPAQIKIRKNIPTKCKTPKRICIKCAVTVISKKSKLFDSKVCENCTSMEGLTLTEIKDE